MDGGTGFRRDSKKTKFIYKGKEIVYNQDRLRPEGTMKTKKPLFLYINIFG